MNIVAVFSDHGAPQRCTPRPPCSLASFRSRRAIRLPHRLPVERPAAFTAAGRGKSLQVGLSSRHSSAYSTPLFVHAALPRCDSVAPPEFRIVKVCGVTRSQDAEAATAAGANAVGMILHRGAKRCVSEATARTIAQAATRGGAEAVGVFVNASAEDINRCARAVGLTAVQLHGDVARAAARDIDADLKVIYVLHAEGDGTIVTPAPTLVPDWVLVDGLQGGAGQALEWTRLQASPVLASGRRGWLLAGGLTPANVQEAIQTCHPSGVDVSSGVCDADMVRKDHQLVKNFVHSAWTAFEKAEKA